jgi:hypothetical protein
MRYDGSTVAMHWRWRRSLLFYFFMRELLAIVRVVVEVVVWVLPTRWYIVPSLSQVLVLVVEIWQRLRCVCVDAIIRVIPMIESRQYRC